MRALHVTHMLHFSGTKSLQFTTPFPLRAMYACVLVDTVRQSLLVDFWDMSLTLQQCEKRKSGWYPIFLTITGCVYIKSILAVSGNGKSLLLWMFTDTRGCKRGSRLANDLGLEISQTSSCTTLQLTHSVMMILIHIQMFKAFFFFSVPVWSIAVCTEHWFG